MLKYATKEDWKLTNEDTTCDIDGGCGMIDPCSNKAKYDWCDWFYCEEHFKERYGD